MDGFVEKLVKKKKTPKDFTVLAGIVVLTLAIASAAFLILYGFLGFLAVLPSYGIVYLGMKLVAQTNLEFEYLMTNDSLDIDKIIARNKRERIFSGSCKEFEAIAKVKGPYYGYHVTDGAREIFAGTSMDAEELYFISLFYQDRKTVVYFEPNIRMLESFNRYIPQKFLVDRSMS